MNRIPILAALFLAGAGLWFALAPLGWDRASSIVKGPAWRMKKVAVAQVTLTYELESDRWLTFELPAGIPALRVMTTADLPRARRADFPTPLPDDVKWVYSVEHEILDRDGRVLASRETFQMTRLSEYLDAELKEVITPTFYLGEDRTPADSRSLIIKLDEVEGAARLRLRLKSLEQPLTRVVTRVYYPGETAAYKLRYLWRRLPAGRAQALARGNVFDVELLTDQEKLNLLRQRLVPVAPVGVEGRDYRQHQLYVLREVEGEAIREAPMPAGLQVDQYRRAVVPLPESGGKVRLEFRATPPPGTAGQSGVIKVHWQGKKLTDREDFTVEWDGKSAKFEATLDGGVLEVECAEPLVVRAYLPSAQAPGKRLRAEEGEITPELIAIWTYLLQGETPVEFSVQPTDDFTPLRMDLRQYCGRAWPSPAFATPQSGRGPRPPTPESPDWGKGEVTVAMLGTDDKVIRTSTIKLSEPASVYDRLHQHRQDLLVSEPKPSYFAVPAGVRRLRFLPTKSPIVLNVFNRPATLVKLCNVPEDYYRFNRDEVAQRSWFLLRAANHQALELKNRVPMLALQSRPSEDEANLLAGVFEWQDHLPTGNWLGRELLVPRDRKSPFRREALPVTFRQVRLDHDEHVSFTAEIGRQEIGPTLLLFRTDEAPLTVFVHIDDVLHHRVTVRSARTVVDLPAVRLIPGRSSRLRVSASGPVRAFVNQCEPGDRPTIVKRLAMRLDKEELAFEYEKVSAAEELLSLFLFQPQGTAGRSTLSARLDAPDAEPTFGPHASWTLRQRRYLVAGARGEPVYALATREQASDEGQTCFFPIGADVPPGRYVLRVKLESGPGGYVNLARTTPGEYERRAFFLEHPAGGE